MFFAKAKKRQTGRNFTKKVLEIQKVQALDFFDDN